MAFHNGAPPQALGVPQEGSSRFLPQPGDVVYVMGFALAIVRERQRPRRRGGIFGRRVTVEYANGNTYRVEPEALHVMVRPHSHSASSTLTSGHSPSAVSASVSRCQLCDEIDFVAALSCGHRACLPCWTRWINGRLDLCHGSPSTMSCWGYRCQTDVTDCLWEMFAALTTAPPQDGLETDGILLMLRRRKLQMNPFFPPSMQVDCRRPSCFGLGYTGSDTIMCFFCEDQWMCTEVDNGTEQLHGQYSMPTKNCPECRRVIAKDGGCDHMTCFCGHEFWWSSLRPYRLNR